VSPARVRELIAELGLEPHPEGGHFREVFRSNRTVMPLDGRPPRTAMTSIFYLLSAGEHSRWHRVASDELWSFHEGEPLELLVAGPRLDSIERVRLDHTRRMHAVPAHHWQAARPTGAYSLVGCTVAPGFEFDDFAFLADDPAVLAGLRSRHPDLVALA